MAGECRVMLKSAVKRVGYSALVLPLLLTLLGELAQSQESAPSHTRSLARSNVSILRSTPSSQRAPESKSSRAA